VDGGNRSPVKVERRHGALSQRSGEFLSPITPRAFAIRRDIRSGRLAPLPDACGSAGRQLKLNYVLSVTRKAHGGVNGDDFGIELLFTRQNRYCARSVSGFIRECGSLFDSRRCRLA
jgi:hypothetical protein